VQYISKIQNWQKKGDKKATHNIPISIEIAKTTFPDTNEHIAYSFLC